jgi:hypothetical protein
MVDMNIRGLHKFGCGCEMWGIMWRSVPRLDRLGPEQLNRIESLWQLTAQRSFTITTTYRYIFIPRLAMNYIKC